MQLEVGAVLEGKVTGLTKFGAFVELPGGKTGMVHISEVSTDYVNDIKDYLNENQVVKVKVLSITDNKKISLSIKRAVEKQGQPRAVSKPKSDQWQNKKTDNRSMSFEDMMTKFKQVSDEKMTDIKKGKESKVGGSRRGANRQNG